MDAFGLQKLCLLQLQSIILEKALQNSTNYEQQSKISTFALCLYVAFTHMAYHGFGLAYVGGRFFLWRARWNPTAHQLRREIPLHKKFKPCLKSFRCAQAQK
jgi:hypothetical protein